MIRPHATASASHYTHTHAHCTYTLLYTNYNYNYKHMYTHALTYMLMRTHTRTYGNAHVYMNPRVGVMHVRACPCMSPPTHTPQTRADAVVGDARRLQTRASSYDISFTISICRRDVIDARNAPILRGSIAPILRVWQ